MHGEVDPWGMSSLQIDAARAVVRSEDVGVVPQKDMEEEPEKRSPRSSSVGSCVGA